MKYELLPTDKRTPLGAPLFQLKALRDVRLGVSRGDLGGYIEKESNLSHEGECWVFDSAQVFGNAHVSGDARVFADIILTEGIHTGEPVRKPRTTREKRALKL
jgi:hypothetical protein